MIKELYIHVPFCARKCGYCDFLSFPAGDREQAAYLAQLQTEIRCAGLELAKNGKDAFAAPEGIASVFIGGGTPSLLSGEAIGEIMAALTDRWHLTSSSEVTIEANPGTVTREKAAGWRRAGINRVSLGLQSADDRLLEKLGRIHSWEDFRDSYALLRQQGFDNINVDLMSGLPGQSERDWEETLRRVTDLAPEHISAYSLIVEEGTPFWQRYGDMAGDIGRYGEYEAMPRSLRERYRDRDRLPGELLDREMYHITRKMLGDAGYARYEISNYAREGKSCRHNIGYWTGAPYLGLGLGASSLVRQQRFRVTGDMKTYLQYSSEDFARGKQYKDRERLSRQRQMEEFAFLGLRMTAGICDQDFRERFQTGLRDVYGQVIDELTAEGWIYSPESGRYALTASGMDVANPIMARFLLD